MNTYMHARTHAHLLGAEVAAEAIKDETALAVLEVRHGQKHAAAQAQVGKDLQQFDGVDFHLVVHLAARLAQVSLCEKSTLVFVGFPIEQARGLCHQGRDVLRASVVAEDRTEPCNSEDYGSERVDVIVVHIDRRVRVQIMQNEAFEIGELVPDHAC